MSDATSSAQSSLITRAVNIIMRPKVEWARIDDEPATVKGLITGYAAPLALIGPVAALIGGQLFPVSVFGTVYRAPVVGAVIAAIVSFVLSLVAVFVLGLIIDALATRFGGTSNRVQAMKVAVYSSTASWLAGVFGLLPALAFLSLAGLYSLYLLFVGLPILMKAPADKAMNYTIVVVVLSIVMWLIVGAITAAVTATFAAGAIAAAGIGGAL